MNKIQELIDFELDDYGISGYDKLYPRSNS